ncbi:xanthine dehydrogenase [Synergistales bacterium]|nr:xanthine dehydrogenase [Synergistales bacterium]
MRDIFSRLYKILSDRKRAVVVTATGSSGAEHALYEGDEADKYINAPRGEESLIVSEDGSRVVIAERFLPRPRMIIFGGGHIAVPLAHVAAMLDFSVTVFDDRPSFANGARFPDAKEVICDNFSSSVKLTGAGGGDYVVIVTRGHKHDYEVLRGVLESAAPSYVGMIGSRRRVAIVRKQLVDEGFSKELVDRVHSPIGLRIGAVTPEEIAISILAEVIQKRRLSDDGTRTDTEDVYADMELLAFLAEERDEPAAIVTVIETEGSTPRGAGAKMAVLPDGDTIGSIGGGCAEADVKRDALDIMKTDTGGYAIKTVDMTDTAEEDGMVCGGTMKVLIEKI